MTPHGETGGATAEQHAVVTAPLDGPHLVDAGAGTGKTYTLVRRVTHLVESGALAPRELLVVTFTNKAAAEIADRMAAALGTGGDGAPTCTTFHGLAARIVRESAYETGRSPDVRAIDPARARALFRRAWAELLDGRLGADASSLPLYGGLDALEESLARIALERQAAGVGLDAFEADALAAAARLAALPYGWRWKRAKRGAISGRPSAERDAASRAAEATREAANVRAVAALLRRYEAILAEAAVLTFGSLLVEAVATLRSRPELAGRLRARYRHALVDEFQDTNPQQLALLRAIFGDGLVPVLAVGDPRQAIYGWNGADPAGVRRFAELAGCTTYALTRNRRSYQPILDRAHAALAGTAHAALGPLVAHRTPAPGAAVACRGFAGGGAIAERRGAEAAAIASEIAALVRGGVPPSSIAVLLRARTHGATYVEAVAARGVPVYAHGNDGFYAAPEIGDALAWLGAVTAPRDPVPLVRLLQSPAFGLSDGALAALRRAAGDAASAAPAEPEPAAVASERRAAAFAAAVLFAQAPHELGAHESRALARFRATAARIARDAAAPVDALAATIALESGIDAGYARAQPPRERQVRANLGKFVELARAFARDLPGARAAEFAREVASLAESDAPEAEAALPGDRVTLMTVHRAKGLEWPYVFVADVTGGVFPSTSSGRARAAAWDARTGALALRHGVDGRYPLRWALREPHDALTGEAREEPRDLEEEHRLFYVALTRAADRVYVSGSAKHGTFSTLLQPLLDADLPSFGEPAPDAAEADGAEAAPRPGGPPPDALDERTAALVRSAFAAREAPPPRAERTVSSTALVAVAACPRRARLRYAYGLDDEAEHDAAAPRAGDGARPGGLGAARAGVAMHRVLERALELPRTREPLASIVRGALAEFDRADDPELGDAMLADARAALAAVADLTPVATERAFDAVVGGVRVRGSVDLVARGAPGRTVIVDYKTGHLDEAACALQLSLYGRVLRAEDGVDPELFVVRVRDGSAARIAIEPVADADLDDALARASALTDDSPRPGPRCAGCGFAQTLCDAPGDGPSGTAVAAPRVPEPEPA